MKQRGKKKSYDPQYSTKGYTSFEIGGTIQEVSDVPKSECQYVVFCVCNKNVRKEFYQRIRVRIPYELDVVLEEGDAVYILGEMMSYYNEDLSRSEIVLTATQVLDANEVPMTGAKSKELPGE